MRQFLGWLLLAGIVVGRPAFLFGQAAPGKQEQPGMESITNRLGMKLVLIPAGEFLMGEPPQGRMVVGSEQHRVRITKPFYLGAYEVTRLQFAKFVASTGYVTDLEKSRKGIGWDETQGRMQEGPRYSWKNVGYPCDDSHPVGNVSWNDAAAFCLWLSRVEGKVYRLPTEAEWEYACRAGATTRYCNGDEELRLAEVGNVVDRSYDIKKPYRLPRNVDMEDGYAFSSPVGKYQPNRFGIYDMHGNVTEWCMDRLGSDYYKESPVDDPLGPKRGRERVLRGGSWSSMPWEATCSDRGGIPPEFSDISIGFRVVVVLPSS